MKTLLFRSLVAALALSPAALFAQGALLPAGAPAPMMKTLAQIEARTPVDTLGGDAQSKYVINLPGSYYLTGPITGATGKDGIRIEAENVTLDLNGFMVDAVAGAQYGIRITAAGGAVVIRNGWVRFFEKDGVYNSGGTKLIAEDLAISGVTLAGIRSDGPALISRCTIRNAQSGIVCASQPADITQCAAHNITGPASGDVFGINCYMGAVRSSEVSGVTGGTRTYGISAFTVQDSVARQVQNATASALVYGISGTNVERCRGESVGASDGNAWGVYANFAVDCTALFVSGKVSCGITGDTSVDQCKVRYVSATTSATGISSPSTDDCRVSQITATNDMGIGISVSYGGTASRNYVENTESHGISLQSYASAYDNYVQSAGIGPAVGNGIDANTNLCVHVERNRVFFCDIGIRVSGAGSVAVRNTATGNSTNFTIPATMTIVTPAALGTNPNANISQ